MTAICCVSNVHFVFDESDCACFDSRAEKAMLPAFSIFCLSVYADRLIFAKSLDSNLVLTF